VKNLLNTNGSLAQITASPDGQDIIWTDSNKIYRLVDVSESVPEPPATLSATGAFENLATLTPRAGLVSYAPIAPLWSDRAKKFRYMSVPNNIGGVAGKYDHKDEKIVFSENNLWGFPLGTVFVKHFSLPLDERDPNNPTKMHKVETRFFVNGEDGQYYAFTYRWRDNQTDADLIPGGDTAAYRNDLMVTRKDGTTYQQSWHYPAA